MLQKLNFRFKKRRGFDLIQVGLYAIAVAILMGVVVMAFNGTFMDGNKRAVATEEVKSIANACALYTVYNNGTPPGTISVLFGNPAITAAVSADGMAHGPFLTKNGWSAAACNDPWGNPYVLAGRVVSVTAPAGNPISSEF